MRANLFPLLLFLFTLTINLLNASASSPPKLHPPEERALRAIAAKLGKANWDFGVDPCGGEGNWSVKDAPKGFKSRVVCDCSFTNGSDCRIVEILLKSENLSGVLPPELSQLSYLKQLDISRNVITGSIPSEWGRMRLESLMIMGNRLSGPFPHVLTKITTLTILIYEFFSLIGFRLGLGFAHLLHLYECINPTVGVRVLRIHAAVGPAVGGGGVGDERARRVRAEQPLWGLVCGRGRRRGGAGHLQGLLEVRGRRGGGPEKARDWRGEWDGPLGIPEDSSAVERSGGGREQHCALLREAGVREPSEGIGGVVAIGEGKLHAELCGRGGGRQAWDVAEDGRRRRSTVCEQGRYGGGRSVGELICVPCRFPSVGRNSKVENLRVWQSPTIVCGNSS